MYHFYCTLFCVLYRMNILKINGQNQGFITILCLIPPYVSQIIFIYVPIRWLITSARPAERVHDWYFTFSNRYGNRVRFIRDPYLYF